MKNIPELYKKYLIKFDDAIEKGLLDPTEVKKIDDFTYERLIGGTSIEKNMLGTPNLNLQ